MKVYVASSFRNKMAARKVIRLLREAGHEITCDWTMHPARKPMSPKLAADAVVDLQGVHDADIVVVVWPGRFGTAAELGAALALGKPTYCIGATLDAYTHWIYLHHPAVKHVGNTVDLLMALQGGYR